MTKKNISCKSAFTLIEMLVVMALMALMLGIGITSFFGIGGNSSLNGALNEVQGALALARQQTVLQNSSVNIYFYKDKNSNDTVYEMWAMTNGTDYSYQQMETEASDALKADRDNKYGYKLGSLYHFPKGLKVSVQGTDKSSVTEIKGNTSQCITFNPTGSSPPAENPKIELILIETGEGYTIKIFSITGLTSVKEIK